MQGYSKAAEHKRMMKGWISAFMVEGSYKVIRTVEEGDYFGEAGCIACTPRAASVVAIEYTELLTLDRKDLMAIYRQYPAYVEELGITVRSSCCGAAMVQLLLVSVLCKAV
jgi:CRP-like cAMP-binding protein